MAGAPGFFDVDERLKRLSDLGGQLEVFRPELGTAPKVAGRRSIR